MTVTYLWHGSDTPRDRFGGPGEPDTLHLGTLPQAAMRCGGKYLHLVAVEPGKARRIRDRGTDKREAILRARRAGVDHLTYLNRYEGIEAADLVEALRRHPGKDFDAVTDREFRRIFPCQRDSFIFLEPASVRVIGCYRGLKSAKAGNMEQITLKGAETRDRPPAAMLDFNEWIGKARPVAIPESRFVAEWEWIKECRQALIETLDDLDPHAPPIFGLQSTELLVDRGVRYLSAPSALIAVDEVSGDFLGGITRGVSFVEEHARRRGIATMMHVCAEESRCVALKPSHFSTGGLASRESAHRLLCERALKRGDPVSAGNLNTYGLDVDVCENEREDLEP